MSEPLPRAARSAHQRALWPLAAAAPLPLPWTGVVGFPAVALYEIVIFLFYVAARRGRPIWVSNFILNLAALLYAAGFLLEIRSFRHGLVKVATHLLLFTAAAKFASLKTFREEQTTLLLCFFLGLDSAASSTHVLSIVYLAALAVVTFRSLARIAILADFGEVLPARILSGLPTAGISFFGVAAIGALSVPLFVSLPRLNSPFATPAIPKEAFEGSFFTSDRVDLNSFPAAKRSDRILLRVIGHSVKLPETLRLREATFNRYVGGQWSRQGLAAVRLSSTAENRVDIPSEFSTAAPLPGPRLPASMDIDASSLTYGFLFVPYGAYSVISAKPISISQDAALSYPGALGGERYQVEYVPQVDGSGPGRAGLALHDVPEEIAALSHRLAAGAAGRRQVAERLVDYFKHGFVYRVDPPKAEGDPVVDFLLRSRQGHCEFFASALALMMRSEGIPARLATGSLGGEIGPFSSELIVRGNNLHAWVEADVDGTGFRVFDPTPPEGLPRLSRVSFWGKLAQLGTEAEFFYDRNILGFSTLEQVSLLEGARDLLVQARTLFQAAPALTKRFTPAFGAVVAGAALALLLLARRLPRRRRPDGARAYLRLRRLYARSIAPLEAATNSAEVIRGFASKGRQPGISARKIVEIYREESFGGKEVDAESRRALRQEWSRLRKALASLAAVLALIVGTSIARAEEAPGAKAPDPARYQELQALQSRLEESKRRLASFEKKTASLKEEVETLNLRLEVAGREREVIAARQGALARQNEDLAIRLAGARSDHDRSLHGLRSRILLLSRLGRFGYLQLLLSARGTGEVFLALKSLDAMARTDAEALSRLNRTSLALERDLQAQTGLAEEAGKLLAADREQENRIAALKQERVRLLSQSQNEATATRREVTELSGKAQKLESLLDLLSRGEPARGSPRPWRGVLDWPAKGKIAVTFGRHRHPKFDAWTVSNGIEIVADDGSPVTAVYSGKVVFARWFADYGNMAVIDHGDEVLSLYARLRAIHVHVGDFVSAGDKIGLVGIGPGETEPSLYFEIRDHQKAADPLAWLR